MSNNRLMFDGMDELKIVLRQLPVELRDEATEPVVNAGETAASALRQNYPPGPMRDGVKVKTERSTFGVSVTVKSTAPESHLWEFGTQNRKTLQGWNRGKAPSHKPEGLVPIAQRNRKRMDQQLIDIVRKAGFEVSGGVG